MALLILLAGASYALIVGLTHDLAPRRPDYPGDEPVHVHGHDAK